MNRIGLKISTVGPWTRRETATACAGTAVMTRRFGLARPPPDSSVERRNARSGKRSALVQQATRWRTLLCPGAGLTESGGGYRADSNDSWDDSMQALAISVYPPPAANATEAPTITGSPQVNEMLTADTSGISDKDGLTGVSYSYQWIRVESSDETDISGVNSST